MKKIFLVFFLGSLLFPLTSLAVGGTYTANGNVVIYEGFVPCGKCVQVVGAPSDPEQCSGVGGFRYINCQICHIFVMLDGIIDFILLTVVPPLATLLLIIAGITFYLGGTSEEKLRWAKSILTSVIIGLVIIYISWIIINTTLTAVGVADWVGFGEGWFQISCEIKL